ncbi:unnamed protein product [Somion occarium]|uniref:BZIP domain-containing protein n=1 Tax=Somion occarium TaxID=3059160 RepID=A0ABP1DXA6_9APHY
MLSFGSNSYYESASMIASSSQSSHVRNQPVSEGDSRVKVEVGTPLLTVSHTFDSLSLSPADSSNLHPVENKPLMPTSSCHRPLRPPTLQPAHQPANLVSAPTLTSNYRHPPQHYSSANGVHFSINASLQNDSPVTISQHGHSSPATSLSSSSPSHHVSINLSSPRPRTSHPVFHTTSALAAHHGIPQSLPPVPRTTRYQPSSAVSTSPSTDFDFSNLCSNYLTMLSQKPDTRSDNMAAVPSNTTAPMSATATADDAAAVQALMDVIQASPEWFASEEFLTSPMEDSPWEEFLNTPAVGSEDIASEFLTSPAIVDSDSFGDFNDMPLFNDMSGPVFDPIKASAPSVSAPALSAFNFDGMLTMPSPNTPSLDPSSLHPSPHPRPAPPPSTRSTSTTPAPRKSAPTGTRKNITPESLVPFDAPIQPRKYVTPSATSRKEIPAVFAKKRARSQAFGDEDGEDMSPAPHELDAIEAKRRQNTLAARRSRKRKLEYQRELEEGIEHERAEKEAWRMRAMTLETILHSHGLEVPQLPAP